MNNYIQPRLVLFVLFVTTTFAFSLNSSHAQQGDIVIHETSGGIGTVRWLGDGDYLSFENIGDIDSGTPSWRIYDLRSRTITISERWPLQPNLTTEQMNAFETDELTALNLCPTDRFVVYSGRRDIRLNGYLSIADLSTGMHIVTDIPTYSPALPDYGLVIVWNIQCTAFTATITGPYGASRIYYITNFANDLTALRYVVSDYVTFGGQEYGILQVWDMTPDGNVILFRGGREGSDGVILYDVLNPNQSQIFFLGNMYTSWAAFDPQDPQYVLVFYESKFVRYDRVSGSVTLLAENAFNDIRAWGNILDLRVSPDGTHVAVTAIEVRNNMRMDIWRLYVVDISDIQLYSTPVPTPTATNTPTSTSTVAFTPTSTFTSTPTSTPTPTIPARFTPLRLRAVCSPFPALFRVWRVENDNRFALPFTWQVVGTRQDGHGVALARFDSYFFTATVRNNPNTVRILVRGVEQDVEPSTAVRCR